VPVHGLVYDENGQPSYAMRFIEGETLRQRNNAKNLRRNATSPMPVKGLRPLVSPSTDRLFC
jgi:hypothetical protein